LDAFNAIPRRGTYKTEVKRTSSAVNCQESTFTRELERRISGDIPVNGSLPIDSTLNSHDDSELTPPETGIELSTSSTQSSGRKRSIREMAAQVKQTSPRRKSFPLAHTRQVNPKFVRRKSNPENSTQAEEEDVVLTLQNLERGCPPSEEQRRNIETTSTSHNTRSSYSSYRSRLFQGMGQDEIRMEPESITRDTPVGREERDVADMNAQAKTPSARRRSLPEVSSQNESGTQRRRSHPGRKVQSSDGGAQEGTTRCEEAPHDNQERRVSFQEFNSAWSRQEVHVDEDNGRRTVRNNEIIPGDRQSAEAG
jgi:hypothetical protein